MNPTRAYRSSDCSARVRFACHRIVAPYVPRQAPDRRLRARSAGARDRGDDVQHAKALLRASLANHDPLHKARGIPDVRTSRTTLTDLGGCSSADHQVTHYRRQCSAYPRGFSPLSCRAVTSRPVQITFDTS